MSDTKPEARRLLYTVADACFALHASRTSLYDAMGKGFVKLVRLGRSVRIPQEEIERIAREGFAAGGDSADAR